jgi:hypothetical protein
MNDEFGGGNVMWTRGGGMPVVGEFEFFDCFLGLGMFVL